MRNFTIASPRNWPYYFVKEKEAKISKLASQKERERERIICNFFNNFVL